MSKGRVHWYCFSYIGKNLGTNDDAHGTSYAGYHVKRITKQAIDDNKRSAGLKSSAVLISCSYLGYMTKIEFLD